MRQRQALPRDVLHEFQLSIKEHLSLSVFHSLRKDPLYGDDRTPKGGFEDLPEGSNTNTVKQFELLIVDSPQGLRGNFNHPLHEGFYDGIEQQQWSS